MATVAALVAVAWVAIDIPEENEVAAAQTSIIYWNDGEKEMARLGNQPGFSLPLEEIPEDMQNAVVAAEDRRFYQHSGFDLRGFTRAMWTNLTTGSAQGGSTITQQYAKNAYLTQDKTVLRKFKELVLSLKLETTLTKEQILERYLNTIFFGRGAYGVQTASEAYFRRAGLRAHPRAGGRPRRDRQLAGHLQPRHQHGQPRDEVCLRPQRHVRGGVHHRGGA